MATKADAASSVEAKANQRPRVVPRDRFQHKSLGTTHSRMQQARVLLVGAGGIGCELLKNLVKSGFKEIHIIDLDTIDLSNLNRQFLFRHEHIKKSKALVAKEVAQRFDPRAQLVAHHANVKDEQFNIQWFAGFDIVFNALDNIDARRHVNRMCLAADVPLIESGTTGFNGNVQVIKKGKTACYDCTDKPVVKSFPVCTVRSTPSQPIHTIVWAKSYLLPELFGSSGDAVADVDSSTNSENVEEIRKLMEESEQLRKLRDSIGQDDFAQKVFEQVFEKDVKRLLSMEDYWKKQLRKPEPLEYSVFATGSGSIDVSISKTDQRLWTPQEMFIVFKDSLLRLSKRFTAATAEASKTGLHAPMIEFDKDDDDTLDFVTAAANLWSMVFSIDPKSKFDTKQMAGNIIPAIATTNAMVAALCVLQAYKVIRNEIPRTKELFLSKANMTGDFSDKPNSECVVCSRATANLQVDLEKATVQDILEKLKADLGYGTDFNIIVDSTTDMVYDYIEAEDYEDAAATRLNMRLTDFGVKSGMSLIVQDDEGEEPRVDLQLFVEDNQSGPAVEIVVKEEEKLEVPRKARKHPEQTNGTTTTETGPQPSLVGAKRKRELDDEGAAEATTPAKKTQLAVDGAVKENGLILLDADDAGTGRDGAGEGIIELD